MTHELRTAAQQALETFEHLPGAITTMSSVQIAMSELRRALAHAAAPPAPVSEPVAELRAINQPHTAPHLLYDVVILVKRSQVYDGMKLYASPQPAAQPLLLTEDSQTYISMKEALRALEDLTVWGGVTDNQLNRAKRVLKAAMSRIIT